MSPTSHVSFFTRISKPFSQTQQSADDSWLEARTSTDTVTCNTYTPSTHSTPSPTLKSAAPTVDSTKASNKPTSYKPTNRSCIWVMEEICKDLLLEERSEPTASASPSTKAAKELAKKVETFKTRLNELKRVASWKTSLDDEYSGGYNKELETLSCLTCTEGLTCTEEIKAEIEDLKSFGPSQLQEPVQEEERGRGIEVWREEGKMRERLGRAVWGWI